ncbi:SpoIIE family protein phosphatase [Kineococcus aurantiacus]|uniref:PAS domain S-box-containing protein n=1 Tax=Kineococcus aurantiacus TaxID=37633 RepID=A0A7Y9DKN0_9ACTN|nr:PAS domain S-box-containing protein [Kineococcus aurantiacus]
MEPSPMQDLRVLPDGTGVDDLLPRALRAVQQAVCISDVSLPDQPVVWANGAFTAETGYPLSEVVGRNCRFLQEGLAERGLDTRGPAARIRRLVEQGLAGTVLIPNRRRDGTVFVNELSLSPLPGPDGRVRFYVAVQRDVTARTQAESARDTAHREAAALSDQLQRQLVPTVLPPVPGLQVAVRYQPATRPDGSRGEVSGDFYDVVPRSDGRALAVIGDVSGRGPRAAATTAALRWAVRGAAGFTDRPAQVLQHVAGAVHDALDDRFGTVALAGYDPLADHVTVSLAGHPQLVLLPARGPKRFVGHPGTLLGPFGRVDVLDQSVPFGPGDCLLLYTDGVTEAQSPERDLLGEEALLAALEGPGDPEVLADTVLRVVTEHVRGGPTDDLTLMVLRRLG